MTLGQQTFAGCPIPSITIPERLTCISAGPFFANWALTDITIPASVTSIESQAFGGSSLKTVTCNAATPPALDAFAFDNYETILLQVPEDSYALYKSHDAWGQFLKINTVTVGIDDITYALDYHSNTAIVEGPESRSAITEANIPERVLFDGAQYVVTHINKRAFNGCTELTSVTIPTTVTSIGASAFKSCSLLASVNISEGVTEIGDSAFERCYSLTSVAIPSSVKVIGDRAFYLCEN